MITEHYNQGANGTNFELSDNSLVIWRFSPYGFTLTGMKGQVKAPLITLISNDDYSKQGSIDSLEYMRDRALGLIEAWGQAHLDSILEAKTLYIVYNNYDDIRLTSSTSVLTEQEIKEQNPISEKILYTTQVDEMGLLGLINNLISYMNG